MNVGLIGLGKAGLRHAAAIQQHAGASVVAAADPSVAAAHAAETIGARHFADYRTMLRDEDLDAVVISVPHHLLCPIALDAALRRVHVLLEKPMAVRREDAEALIRSCRDNDVRLMVNFVHRFRSESRQARMLIQAGAIGRPVLAVELMASGASDVPDWVWRRESSGGGMMMYNGIHGIDRVAWFVESPIVEVSAAAGTFSYPVDVEDTLVATLRFANGCLGSIVQHKAATATLKDWHTTVYGTRGALRVTNERGLELTTDKERVTLETSEDKPFLGAFREFSTAIGEERDPSPSGEDGLRALSAVLALYESARSGEAVRL
jgi:predicted dehydrogenase